jgi:asparagine synthase (glutamine-hydrolysing)
MCGIFGFVGDPEKARSLDLDTAVAAMRHRGPDDSGTFRALPSGLANGIPGCALAHVRLAVIDLSPAGHQPMSSADGRFTITYNGEVFNFRQIRSELEGLGDTFHSDCDTEVVLQSFVRWGPDCVRRFRGMFAFGIWDAAEHSLFLARDRLGIKPLYHTSEGKNLAFASEIRTLLACGLVPRRLSPEGLASYMAFGSVYGPDTILQGVKSLDPGCTIVLQRDRRTLRRYWSIPLENNRDETVASAMEAVVPLTREAVRLRLVSDVPLGVFLSGATDRPVHTFTVTFDEAAYSEARYAAEVARSFGCDHHQVHLPSDRAATDIDGAVAALDQPSVDGINSYFVSRAAKDSGLTVALSGLGGDEVFGGYDSFRIFSWALRAGRVAGLPVRFVGGAIRGLLASGRVPYRVRKALEVVLAGGDPLDAYAALRGLFTGPETLDLVDRECIADRSHRGVLVPDGFQDAMESGGLDPVSAYSILDLSNYMRNTLLRDTDAASMAHALEVRVPLIDHLLVERMMRVPGPVRLSGPTNKPLLTACVPELPSVAVHRRKMGFTLPFEEWLRGSLRSWAADALLGEPVRMAGFFRPEGVRRLWTMFGRGRQFVSFSRVWALVVLARWCARHRVQAN